jgi:hypothetical protein
MQKFEQFFMRLDNFLFANFKIVLNYDLHFPIQTNVFPNMSSSAHN